MKRIVKSIFVFACSVSFALMFPMRSYAERFDGPEVVKASVADSPYAFPANNGMVVPSCYEDDGSPPKQSFECPTIKNYNLTYWPMTYDDNRLEVLLVGVSKQNYGIGKPKLIRVCGLRYIWKIDVDESRKQVTLFGQTGAKAYLPWPILADNGRDQTTCGR